MNGMLFGMGRVVGVVTLLAFDVLWVRGTGWELPSWLLGALIVVVALEALGTAFLMIEEGGFRLLALLLWVAALVVVYAAADSGPVFWIAASMAVGAHLLCLAHAIVVLAFEAACDRARAFVQRASCSATADSAGEGAE